MFQPENGLEISSYIYDTEDKCLINVLEFLTIIQQVNLILKA